LKRFAKWFVGISAAFVLLNILALWVLDVYRHASAAPAALAALNSDAEVDVTQRKYLEFRPLQQAIRGGVIFYPGANADFRGYSRILRQVAAAGYLVCVVPMPLQSAILGINRANGVMASHADVQGWAIIGHSLGGAMAAQYASGNHDALAGVIIWDSYPASIGSLADFRKPVWHIHRARPDGTPPPKFAARRALFPPNSTWVPIPGGIHMYFGDFVGGGYKEDWLPSISQEEHQRLALAATLGALKAIFPRAI
jgi:hypothetical protein